MVIIYYIFIAKAWLLSKLPLRILYLFSDVLRFFLQHIIRYRRTVIVSNLQASFPGKSSREIKFIASSYYRNLADIIIEVIKWRSIGPKQMLRRFSFENLELLDQSFEKGKSVIIAIGHCGNWEWMGTALGLITPQKGYAVVKPLSDKRFNHYLEFLRHRLNHDSTIPFKSAFRRMVVEKNKHPFFSVFAADQTPTRDEINFWMNFLNQDTGFFLGIEKIAKALDMNVIFIDIRREARGRYKGHLTMITDHPSEEPEFMITKKYIRSLEQAINQSPDNWLWSHRRWKHHPEADDHIHK